MILEIGGLISNAGEDLVCFSFINKPLLPHLYLPGIKCGVVFIPV